MDECLVSEHVKGPLPSCGSAGLGFATLAPDGRGQAGEEKAVAILSLEWDVGNKILALLPDDGPSENIT